MREITEKLSLLEKQREDWRFEPPANFDKSKEFVRKFQGRWNLKEQLENFGSILRKPLPLFHLNSKELDLFLLKHMGSTIETFLSYLEGNSSGQDKRVVLISQASGSGKSKLCCSIGQQRKFIIWLRLSIRDRRTSHVVEMIDWIREIEQKVGSKTVEDCRLRANLSLNIVRLWIYAHIHWGLLVLKELNGKEDEVKREALVQAFENGSGEEAVRDLLANYRKQFTQIEYSKWRDEVPEYWNTFEKKVDHLPLVFAYDEVKTVSLFPGLFYHLDEFVGNSSGDQQYEQDKKIPAPTRESSQVADLFYALRLAVLEILDKTTWPQIMTDTHLSIWESQLLNVSPLRGRVAHWHSLDRFTAQLMGELLCEYFAIDDIPLDIQNKLKCFEGRPLFFCVNFFPRLISKCLEKRPSTKEVLLAMISELVPIAFRTAVENLYLDVLYPSSISKQVPDSSQQMTVAQMIIDLQYRIFFEDCKIKLEDVQWQKDLISIGLLSFDPSMEDIKYLDLRSEPVFLEGMHKLTREQLKKPLDQDPMYQRFANQLHPLQPSDSAKGNITEEILIWHFIRTIIKNGRECSLSQLLAPLAVTELPDEFEEYVVTATSARRQNKQEFLFEQDINEFVFGVDVNAGPDLVVPFKFHGQPNYLVIQVKARQDMDIIEALRSVNPGYFYTTIPQRKWFISKSMPQKTLEESKKCFSKFKQFRKKMQEKLPQCNMIRAIFSGAPFTDKMISDADEHNQNFESEQVAFLTLPKTPDAFGSSIMKELNRLCGSKALTQPKDGISLKMIHPQEFAKFEEEMMTKC